MITKGIATRSRLFSIDQVKDSSRLTLLPGTCLDEPPDHQTHTLIPSNATDLKCHFEGAVKRRPRNPCDVSRKNSFYKTEWIPLLGYLKRNRTVSGISHPFQGFEMTYLKREAISHLSLRVSHAADSARSTPSL